MRVQKVGLPQLVVRMRVLWMVVQWRRVAAQLHRTADVVVVGTQHTGGRISSLRLSLACGHQTVEVKLVGIPLSVHLGHDVLVVVVPANRKCTNIQICFTS